MSSEMDNLILEHLRHIRTAVDLTNQKLTELTFGVGMLEQQYASMSNRIDRIDARLDRIEARIGLIDA